MKLSTKLFFLIPSAIILTIFTIILHNKSATKNEPIEVNSNEISMFFDMTTKNRSLNVLLDLKNFKYLIPNNVCDEMSERDDFIGNFC
jgi:hypothetical protein